jgi:hypothetical protein
MSDKDDEKRSRQDAALRMRKWRERKRQRLGGLVQVLVWVRSEHENALRSLFEKLADPDWIGEAYRAVVAPWLLRNRPPAQVFDGDETRSEIDRPFLDDGARVVPMGGRVFGTGDTMVELTPFEAAELDKRIKVVLDEVHTAFIREFDLQDRIRDTTGVIAQEQASYLRGTKEMVREYDVDRPVGEAQFWANERTIARRVMSLTEGVPEDRGEGCFIYPYAGLHRFPSRCLVVTSLRHPEFQSSPEQPLVALVKLDHGGTPPTVCFERLASELRRALLPETPADAINWYDASRDALSPAQALQITRVKLEQGKSDYDNPVWQPDEQRNHAFFRFIRKTLTAYEQRQMPPEDIAALAAL